jgi:hypothetical protein
MNHAGHTILVMMAFGIVVGAGLIFLGLAWRRRALGQCSGVVIEGRTAMRELVEIAAVPAIGIVLVVGGLLVAGALLGRPPN